MGRPRSTLETITSLRSQQQFVEDLISQYKPRSPITRVLVRLLSARLRTYSNLRQNAEHEDIDPETEYHKDRLSRLCDAYEKALEVEKKYISELPAFQDLHFERYSYLYGEYLPEESKPQRIPCDHRHKTEWARKFRTRLDEDHAGPRLQHKPMTDKINALYELLVEEPPEDRHDPLYEYLLWDLEDEDIIGSLITVEMAKKDLEMITTRFPREQAHMVSPFQYAIGHCLEHEFNGLYVDPSIVTGPSDAWCERLILGDNATRSVTPHPDVGYLPN